MQTASVWLRCKLCTTYFANEKALSSHCLNSHGQEFLKLHLASKREVLEDLNIDEVNFDPLFTSAEETELRLLPLSVKVKRNSLTDLINRSPRKPPFICPICHIQHNTWDRLSVHLRRHTGERPYVCFCEKSFASDLELSRHIRRMHRDGALTTTMGSQNGLGLSDASKKIIKKKRYSCSFCGRVYDTTKDLNAHILSHVGQESFECETCELEFSTHTKLLNHKLTMHPSTLELVKCRHCGKSFPCKDQMRSHINEEHKTVMQPMCKICDIAFPDIPSLRAHKRQHAAMKKSPTHLEDIKPNIKLEPDMNIKLETTVKFEPDEDNNYQPNSDAILPDLDDSNSNESSNFEHVVATKSTTSEPESSVQTRIPVNVYPTFSCPHCDMGFGKKTSLKLHMHVHFKVKNFHCPQCSSKFQTANQLSFHVKTIHNPNKDFACDLCENRFSHKGALVRHFSLCHKKDNDIGVTRFICKFCKLEFPTRKEHNSHFTVHDVEKKFSCLQCGRRFHRSDYLKKHLLTHTGERPFKCDLCPKGFNRKDNLKKHIIKNHKGIEQ